MSRPDHLEQKHPDGIPAVLPAVYSVSNGAVESAFLDEIPEDALLPPQFTLFNSRELRERREQREKEERHRRALMGRVCD